MSKRVKILGIMLAMLLSFGLPSGAASAAPTSMSMQGGDLLILPEYDQNNVIVNFGGTFLNDTGGNFDGEIWYYVPKDAEIFMVCETERGMSCVLYDADTIQDDYRIVKWKPSRLIKPGEKYPVMFEYTFMPNFQEVTRNFDVLFKTDAKIEGLGVEIKQPLRSIDFWTEPNFQLKGQDGNGFSYYQKYFSLLERGEELSFNIGYNKADNQPSMENQQGGVSVNSADQGSNNNIILIALATGLLVVLIAIVALAFNQNKQPSKVSRKGIEKGKRPAPKKQSDEKRRIRQMLMDGKISEQTYNRLLEEIDG